MFPDTENIKIDALIKSKWKKILDFTAQMTECSHAYIMYNTSDGIEILVKGTFGVSEVKHLLADASALCKIVIDNSKELIIQNIQANKEYKNIKSASAFMAYPILLPDKKACGALCVIDARVKQFWNWSRQLLSQYAEFATDELGAIIEKDGLNKKADKTASEQLAKIFNLLPTAIIVTATDDGRVIDANDSYFKLFGFNRDEIIGKTGMQLFVFDDPNIRRVISGRLENAQPLRDFETSLLTKSGETLRVILSVEKAEFLGIQCLISTILDLSPTIDLERNIKTINERLSLAAHAADMGVWDYNIPKQTLAWDDRSLKLFDVERKNLTGKLSDWLAIIHPDDRESAKQKLNGAMHEKEFSHEYRVVRQAGQIRYIKAYGHTQHDETGAPMRITGVNFDMTDIRKAQAQTREIEQKYRSLFHNNNAIQIIVNSDTGEIVDANSAACEFYGHSSCEIKQIKIWNIDDSNEGVLRKQLNEIYNKSSDSVEMVHRRFDGQLREMEVFCGCVSFNGDKFLHMIIHDVTERKRIERGLIESENRFRLFVESAPDGVLVEMDGIFAYVNRKTVELFGVSSEYDLLGKPIEAFFPKKRRKGVLAFVKRLNVLKKPVSLLNETIESKDGTEVAVEISAVPFNLGGEAGAIIFFHDISKRRKLEDEKIYFEAQLRQKQKLESIGVLAGGVAHEINNPVSGIINYAQLIYETLDYKSKTAEYCADIVREGRRIADIVKNLLKFARQEKQTHSVAQVNDIINDTLSFIRTILKKDSISLELELDPDLPCIKCRSQQIQQVLMNLITNARDALNARYKSDNNNKKIVLSSATVEKDGNRCVQVTVMDSGTGIPDSIKEKLFDPFFTTKSRDEGTGLGLSISHGIVEDHRGALYFDSQEGEYTRAVLELPINNGWTMTARMEG